MVDRSSLATEARVHASETSYPRCYAPQGFQNQDADLASPAPATRGPPERLDGIVGGPSQSELRALIERRYGRGKPLHFQPLPARPQSAVADAASLQDTIANELRPDTSALDDANLVAVAAPPLAGTPGTSGMTRPTLLTLARPSLAIRALGNMTYGATLADLTAFNALGSSDTARLTAWVDTQLNHTAIDDSALESRLSTAGYTTLGKSLKQQWAEHRNNPDYGQRMRPGWEVQRAALVRAVHSRRQLHEIMTTFWHDHFNVQATNYDAAPVYGHYDRDVIRANAFGNFRTMLEAVAQSNAMMYYLDNRSNKRAGPNENFARELMELHTFGAENYLGFMDPFEVPPCPEDNAYPIGYTDIDVYETASAFTGWTVADDNYEFPDGVDDGTFYYFSKWHDTGPKYVLGTFLYPETPELKDGRDILDRLASHPRVAKFICKKIIRHFLDDSPSQGLIDSAARVFRDNWKKPDQIKRVMRHILLSDAAMNNWGRKRRRPFEAVAAAVRLTGSDFTLRLDHDKSNEFMWRLGFTGHVPYDWPAPNGYPDVGVAWAGSNSFVMTWRLLNWWADTQDNGAPVAPVLAATRSGVSQWSSTALVEFWCRRLLGYLPARRQIYIDFMRQNAPANEVITDTDDWSKNDLRKHYNQQRLRSMVSLILMSPEFLSR